MCITTKLRVLRLKYKISLMELAKQGGLSNQHTEDQAQGAACGGRSEQGDRRTQSVP